MFKRKQGVADATEEALGAVTPYVDQLATDEKLRQRLAAAITAGLAARQQARRRLGVLGLLGTLASDRILRAQLNEAVTQLQRARRRVEKRKSHTTRNWLLIVAGTGIAVAAAPKVRTMILRKLRSSTGGSQPTSIQQDIEVDAPVDAVYRRWTQFEQFPEFMEGVDEVRRLNDDLLHWAVTIAGKKAEWDARITAQEPDRRIAWVSVDGKQNGGSVSFVPVGSGRTRIHVQMSYRADGVAETAGAAVGLDERRVRGDLERFRELVEQNGSSKSKSKS